MARSGIYKSEVVRARDKLLALGRYPSIDAVRAELGNTGSKATIHRYLKEIEEEQGGKTGTQVAISEALQDLVARLAERLHEEADARMAALAARHAGELEALRNTVAAVEADRAAVKEALDATQAALNEAQTQLQKTTGRLQEEVLAHAVTRQHTTDLQEQLAAGEAHRQSLEEKHSHARLALEHFRTAAKEQREQELRQHEQQVQYLQGEIRTLSQSVTQKQHEITQSSQDNARLATELARSEKSLHDARAELRTLKAAGKELVAARQQIEQLGRRVVELEAAIAAQTQRHVMIETERAENQATIRQLQLELAAAHAAAETQEQLATQIHGWLTQVAATAVATEKPSLPAGRR